MTTHRVFVSRPTTLTAGQNRFCSALGKTFELNGLESHTVGFQDFTNRSPLTKVLEVMSTCDGACILGFVQVKAKDVVVKPGTRARRRVAGAVFATPWNQLEAGMALIRGLPLFVICEPKVTGGVFDDGVADAYVHRLPARGWENWLESAGFVGSLQAWINAMRQAIPARAAST